MKKLKKEKIGRAFMLCSRCVSRKVNVGVDNVFLFFFKKTKNKKNRLMSSDFPKNYCSISETLFPPRFQLHSPNYFACLVAFFFFFFNSDIFLPRKRFFISISNVKRRELNKKIIIIIRGKRLRSP